MSEDEERHANSVSRRRFLQGSVMGGAGILVSGWGLSPWIGNVFHRRGTFVYPDRPPNWPGVETNYSVCKQCGSDCGIEAHIFNGVLEKLDGNPYHPASTEPHAPYATRVSTANVWPAPHSLCPRGQAGRQTVYDPYRITVPLKRKGPRGSGQGICVVIKLLEILDCSCPAITTSQRIAYTPTKTARLIRAPPANERRTEGITHPSNGMPSPTPSCNPK